MTGNIGRPGTGANSITGQCNAMGSRLFSNTTNLLGGRDFTNASDRADVAGLLGFHPDRIPSVPSLAYDQIIEGILGGKIKALWIVATNPAHSWINQSRLQGRAVAPRLPRRPGHVPGHGDRRARGHRVARRRLGRERRARSSTPSGASASRTSVCKAPGQALADFHIFKLIAEAWGCGDLFRDWTSPEAVFQILKRLSRGRPATSRASRTTR